ncbi:hypothetical protein [Moraxella marmotae]|uniref:hypothetical protein n=1 Tax=Moraxella marmotae TaxID=3344520 RepID=UPI0035F49B12
MKIAAMTVLLAGMLCASGSFANANNETLIVGKWYCTSGYQGNEDAFKVSSITEYRPDYTYSHQQEAWYVQDGQNMVNRVGYEGIWAVNGTDYQWQHQKVRRFGDNQKLGAPLNTVEDLSSPVNGRANIVHLDDKNFIYSQHGSGEFWTRCDRL